MSTAPHTRPAAGRHDRTPQRDRLFVLRNWINCLFMIMAAIAMGGMAYGWIDDGPTPQWPIYLCVVAVLLKMVEVALRMPVMLKGKDRRDRTDRKTYTLDDFADRRQTTAAPEHPDIPQNPDIPEHPATPQAPKAQKQD